MQSILQQVSLSPSLERTKNLHIAGVGRQHDHFCVGKFISDSNERIEAVHLRHLQVHQRNVRMVRPELLDGLATVGRFTYHHHVRLNANQTRYAVANQCMVVNRKNSNLRASGAHDLFHAFALAANFRENHEPLRADDVCDVGRKAQFHFGSRVDFAPHGQLASHECGAFPHAGQAVMSLSP